MPEPKSRKQAPKRGLKPKPKSIVNEMPKRIDADPRDVARAIVQTPPKKSWRFLKKKSA
ncbi:MAG: hypothetical protein OXG16_08060 [Rhodospirillales bacterium]|nr:hypothetical protein [Rhodospirillales bacterium]